MGHCVKNSPLVSVIIPIYNVEQYLQECLDSVLNQTYKHLEIILVNDGSTDKSPDIAQEYAKKDSRIRYFTQENKGGGVARNIGLDNARGEWVLIFDSDDYMRPFAIETLLQRALEANAQIVIAQSEELRDGRISLMDWALRLDLVPNKLSFNYKDLGDNVFGFCVGWAWDKLYKRDFIESYALRFQNIQVANDLYFTFMGLIMTDSISICDKVLFTHRKHSTSLETSRDGNPALFLESVKKWHKTLKSLDIFSQVERSIMNWTLSFCLWHLHTLSDDRAHYRLFKVLKRAFCDLGLRGYPQAKFYNQKHYKQMCYILRIPLWLHRLNTFRVCDMKGLFRMRVGEKGCVIRLFGITLYNSYENNIRHRK